MSFGRNSRALNKQPLSNAVTRLGIRTEELQGDRTFGDHETHEEDIEKHDVHEEVLNMV